ncbi:MAG: metallophosphoesterase [Armatimonadetes bacterium]|nr:metallophosphoesterase [Armatimonadota bacterium]
MSVSRREFLAGTTLLALSPSLLARVSRPGLLKIGILTDAHYADADTRGTRHYSESLTKMQEAVEIFRREEVTFAIETGDLIDAADARSRAAELAFLRQINHQFMQADAPTMYVLGNHCVYSLNKSEFLRTVGQKESYFSSDVEGWHIVVLDACFRKDGEPYYRGDFDWTDTEIPAEEREWLKSDLDTTDLPTLVFVHQRVDLDKPNHYAVHSASEVRSILSDSAKVAAVFQGHSHTNELNEIDGVNYVTLTAMVEGGGDQNNAYSVLHCESDGSIKLVGYRKHSDHPFVS